MAYFDRTEEYVATGRKADKALKQDVVRFDRVLDRVATGRKAEKALKPVRLGHEVVGHHPVETRRKAEKALKRAVRRRRDMAQVESRQEEKPRRH